MTLEYKWPVIGHAKQLEQLEEDLKQGRLSHAYLFSGPSQIGKMPMVRTLAQILQCENNYCRECSACHQIEKGQHIDTIFLRDEGESLKIEDIRELLTHLSTTSSSNYKIIIIQRIERMTPEAANAFLKTLEEPIPGVIFLLTTTQKQKLLDTIISRVRVISLHALSDSVIRDYLVKERSDLDKNTLEMMAAFSMGKPGRALIFSRDPDRFRWYRDMYHQVARFLERSKLVDRMLYVEELLKDPEAVNSFMELFIHAVRGLILQKLEGKQMVYSFEELFAMVEYLKEARFELEHNVNQRLVLENLMTKF
tara:strand:- start:2033 stop:2959 length:927 start_codon:yes stop_codon:yes gene_type:complete